MKKVEVICSHCKHTWKTSAKTAVVTCAGCGFKTKNNLKDRKDK